MRYYNTELAVKAATKVAEIWKTNLLISDKECSVFMNNIRLPSNDKKKCL